MKRVAIAFSILLVKPVRFDPASNRVINCTIMMVTKYMFIVVTYLIKSQINYIHFDSMGSVIITITVYCECF